MNQSLFLGGIFLFLGWVGGLGWSPIFSVCLLLEGEAFLEPSAPHGHKGIKSPTERILHLGSGCEGGSKTKHPSAKGFGA